MLSRIALLYGLLLGVGTALRSYHQGPPQLKRVFGPEKRTCWKESKSRARANMTVIGGTLVDQPSEFPFLTWVGDYDGTGLAQFCGGTLISDRVVLTAAHCLYSDDTRNSKIYVRFQLTDFESQRGIVRGVINWKQHESYNTYTMFDDLALLLLNESVTTVPPVKVSDGTQSFETSGNKEVVGWGSIDEECDKYDTLLRKANVPMGTAGDRCSTPGSHILAPDMDFDHKRQICAGQFTSGSMRYPGCGDSGGPLLQQEGSAYTQVGMVSWTYGAPYPDVFTRVSYYRGITAASSRLLQEGRKQGVEFKWW
mmetsp:Transcript_51503/g.159737  ORF Transcript_51503/g.159737 Transcript_51503/m.159737 type:complete len:310 (-) Transcript_51503:143-1072(-)